MLKPRRQIVVDRPYQTQFAVLLILFQVNIAFVFFGIMQYRIRSIAEDAGTLDAFLDKNLWMECLPVTLLVALGMSVVVYGLGLWFSNKIVGPMPRLRRALGSLATGDFSGRINFRPGDALEPVARDVNSLAEALEKMRLTGVSAPADPRTATTVESEVVTPV